MKYDDEKGLYYVLQSNQNKPLKLWDKKIRAGHIYQLQDPDLNCKVLELVSVKSSRTYISCPANPKEVLGIRAPFLHLIVKNLKRSFGLDILIKDSNDVLRKFRVLTKQKETQLQPFLCKMPLSMDEGWNQIVVPLKEFTKKAFGSIYVETLRLQMYATCRVQRIYFSQEYNEVN